MQIYGELKLDQLVIRTGQPAIEIVKVAEVFGAQLIIMGGNQANAWTKWLTGGTVGAVPFSVTNFYRLIPQR